MRWFKRKPAPEPTPAPPPAPAPKPKLPVRIMAVKGADVERRKTFKEWSRSPEGTSYRDRVNAFREVRDSVCRSTEARLAEQFGDIDDHIVGSGGGHSLQYRPVSFSGELAMPVENVRAISEARYLHVKSPLKTSCDNLTARYVAGDGYEIVCADGTTDDAAGRLTAQEVVEAFRADPYNRIVDDAEELCKRYRIDGQLVLLTSISRSDKERGITGGRVRVRRWDPRDIVAYRFEHNNPDAPEYLRLVGCDPPEPEFEDGEGDRSSESHGSMTMKTSMWRVVRLRDAYDEDDPNAYDYSTTRERTIDGAEVEGGMLDGDALWFRANSAMSDIGLPDGVAAFHAFDMYDELRVTAMKAARVKSTYALSIGLDGFTLDQLEETEEAYELPDEPAIFFHNEKSRIEGVTFDLGANQIEEHLLGVKKLAIGTYGFPPSFVSEDNATLATALAQSAPTLKAMQAKQAEFREVLRTIYAFVIDSAVAHGALPADVDRSFEIVMSPLSADQSAAQASTLNATALALSGAVAAGYADPVLAQRAFLNALKSNELMTDEEIADVYNSEVGAAPPPPEPVDPFAELPGMDDDGLTPQEKALKAAYVDDPNTVVKLLGSGNGRKHS